MGKSALAVITTLPPWGAILFHLGACREAIIWAARRPVNAETLAACPSREWRVWLAKKTHTRVGASWKIVKTALVKALSRDGYGYGSGSGYGSGYGSTVSQ